MAKKKPSGDRSGSGKEKTDASERGAGRGEAAQGAGKRPSAGAPRPREPEAALNETADESQQSEDQAARQEAGVDREAPPAAAAPGTEDLERAVSDLQDQLLRKQAEFENFRKRMVRDREDGIRYANQMLLLDLISVIDDFERAIASAQESQDFAAFHSGVVLIEKQLTSMLESKWGLRRFDSVGEEFDPDKHQAIALEESAEAKRPTVNADYQKGYFYHDRVLRPAKVKVAQPVVSAEAESETEDSQGE